MQSILIQAAVYLPTYFLGRMLGDYTGHPFLLGWIIGGTALMIVQSINATRSHG